MAPPASQEAPGDTPDGSRPGRRAAAAAARQRLQGWTGALAAPEGSSSGEGRGSSSGAMSGGCAGSKGSGKTSQGRGSGGSSGAKHKGSPPRKRHRAEDDADYTEDGSSGEATSSGGRGGGAARAVAGTAGGGGGAARPAGKVVLRPKGFKADRGASSELKGVSRHKNTGKFEVGEAVTPRAPAGCEGWKQQRCPEGMAFSCSPRTLRGEQLWMAQSMAPRSHGERRETTTYVLFAVDKPAFAGASLHRRRTCGMAASCAAAKPNASAAGSELPRQALHAPLPATCLRGGVSCEGFL
jgi:hypothetical protein